MTYNVFGGTLNPTLLGQWKWGVQSPLLKEERIKIFDIEEMARMSKVTGQH